MTLEQQYPSPERCEKLKELGFPMNTTLFMRILDKAIVQLARGKTFYEGDYYPYPSVPEMLQLVPMIEIKEIGKFLIRIDMGGGQSWKVSLVDEAYGEFYYISFNDSFIANAVADCLIWLVENKFISFDKKV